MNTITFGEQPSDKEELEAVLENCPILTQDTITIVEQANKMIALGTENAELKKAVEGLRKQSLSTAKYLREIGDTSREESEFPAAEYADSVADGIEHVLKQTEGLV